MSTSKITEIELDMDIAERIPKHAQERLKEIYAERSRKADQPSFSHVHEKMGSRLDMPVPHDLRGRKVRVTLEVVE